ncbi:tRNA (adenosine(37)-N6)-threonylcarbamoyltransferase complex ATPase subunit type 1 TsaE [Thalassococcus sp. S3]|uniref:tRNA (adenosine(37)-N6)-threonylcarbamoyltransferase complex ATPase subunit type 1 TsaE n=1 Tax=Thalassococcus sp. S3 TaxID=2017482 RepID=UPI001023F4E8|nr:tRNA (adenosine(37)-N6)-threonylcarbamoyltransferase complex ATPase subunit type 1 TsaE [Thalassococcus sp. S3]QBF29617.1 tRNA (adenosine(37)-N6)-threonylcarbamoyltransferase complex ATPase subunit type 1 TsaE [Thalassococcus sp. S3]
MQCRQLKRTSKSESDTAAIARVIAKDLAPGDTILLEGEIGAGKTHFARAMIQSLLDMPEDVPSPTFTLVQTYDTTKGEVWHADLYRITSMDELEELGLNGAFETAICLVEWPDRMADMAPSGALHLKLDADATDDGVRHLTFCWSAAPWTARLNGLTA